MDAMVKPWQDGREILGVAEKNERRSIGLLRCVFMPGGRAGCRKRLLCYSAALFSSFCSWALMNSLPATTEPVSSIVSLPSMSLT